MVPTKNTPPKPKVELKNGSEQPKQCKLRSCQKMCNALRYLLDNISIRFAPILYRQNIGIQIGTNCAALLAGLFLFFMRETSCCLCVTIIKMILLKFLTPSPDI